MAATKTTRRTKFSEDDLALLQSVPIPQADNLDRVFDVVKIVYKGKETAEEIAKALGVVERQGLYYLRAAIALKLIGEYTGAREHSSRYFITSAGRAYMNSGNGTGKRKVVRNSAIMRYLAAILGVGDKDKPVPWPIPDAMFDVDQVAEVLSELGLTGSTALRRAYTMKAWLTAISE